MRARNPDQTLDNATDRAVDDAHRRFARLASGSRALTPAEDREAARLFKLLTDLETRRRTPVEAMVARMPRPFVDLLRAALRRHLDAKRGRRGSAKTAVDRDAGEPKCG